MSKFGWSYPAGAENDPNAPYNQPDAPEPNDDDRAQATSEFLETEDLSEDPSEMEEWIENRAQELADERQREREEGDWEW